MQHAPLQRAAHRAHSHSALGVHDRTRGGGRGLGIVWIVINCAAWVMPMKVATWAKGEWRNARRASVLGEVRDELIEWHGWW